MAQLTQLTRVSRATNYTWDRARRPTPHDVTVVLRHDNGTQFTAEREGEDLVATASAHPGVVSRPVVAS